jgi:hypothetical protein
METIDYETLSKAVAAKVWENMNVAAGNLTAAPFEEQNDMVRMNLISQVMPLVTVTVPVVKAHAEQALKDKLIAVINESHDEGHDAEFTLLAITAELSEDGE